MCFRPYFTDRFTYFWAILYASAILEAQNLGRPVAVAAKFALSGLIF